MYQRPDTTDSNFRDVAAFHEKFGLTVAYPPGPREVPPELLEFRVKFMQEELDEFKEGMAEEDHEKMFDALLDLAYVVFGTAHFLGYPWQQGWHQVQWANMQKVRAASDGSDSKRGSSFDVVKPPNWTPPDIMGVLRNYGFPDPESGERCNQCHRRYDGERVKCYPPTAIFREGTDERIGTRLGFCDIYKVQFSTPGEALR